MLVFWICAILALGPAQPKPRTRDLGVPLDGTPGPLNAITDVAGVEVGHTTLISGDSVRTGVTAVLPRGRQATDSVFAAWFSQNGDGEMTGTTWIEESGFLDGPVMITNTHSVGLVRDAVIAWQVRAGRRPKTNTYAGSFFSLPVVAETYDGRLNDINGFHVKEKHVFDALDGARAGPVPEGNVGGGTGMICYGFKGGIGTASRKAGDYTVGALVQCNCGLRTQLMVAGVPVGRETPEGVLRSGDPVLDRAEVGSIIIVVATDAPLLPHQLKRLARRATMGLARTGSTSGNSSGDIFLAFSTANSDAANPAKTVALQMLPNNLMNPLFAATAEAVEEAILNAMVTAETMTGNNGNRVIALPHDRLQQAMKKYNRIR
ncbi:MAG: P1 family peptidase [Acidobacteria bacterium]|nr:P1 family peptidase [Acidobacteriota bacterium]